MADKVEKTGILKFEVDQQDGITELENLKNVIVGLKLEQAQLNKDFKSGTITQKEYAQETVRVENVLKKTNIAYNEQQRAILGVKSFTEKLGDELRKKTTPTMAEFSKQASAAAKNMTVAGVNINSVTQSLSQFMTPGSAAVGLLGALGAAYASSAAGAEDLAHATDQLNGSLTILSNNIGNAFTTGDSGSRRGFFSSLADSFLQMVSPTLAAQSNLLADAKEKLRELQIIQIDVQGIRKEYEKAAEDARRIRDDETKTLDERIAASKNVEQQLNANLLVRKKTQEEIVSQLRVIAALSGNDPSVRAQIKQAQAEVRDIQEEINGKLTENVKALQQLKTLYGDVSASQTKTLAGGPKGSAVQDSVAAVTTPGNVNAANLQLETIKTLDQAEKTLEKQRLARKKKNAEDELKIREFVTEAELELLASAAGTLAGLFEQQSAEYKIFASAETLMSTYSAAQKQFEAFSSVPPLAYAAAIAAVAAGLGRVAQINEVQFAEGGYTGPGGKYDVAGVVHKDEYVVPKHIVHNPKYSGHVAVLEQARLKGYYDGGMVTNQFVNQTSQSVMLSQLMQNFEKIQMVVSVKEITTMQNRVKVKQNTGIGGKKNAA